jgi:hypothetical protein
MADFAFTVLILPFRPFGITAVDNPSNSKNSNPLIANDEYCYLNPVGLDAL